MTRRLESGLLAAVALFVGGCTGGGHAREDGGKTGASRPGTLFVITAERGSASRARRGEFVLTLENAFGRAVVFTDRPRRQAATMPLGSLVELWSTTIFRGSPPNAAIEVEAPSHQDVLAVELSAPRFGFRQRLRFNAKPLAGPRLPRSLRAAFARRADASLPRRFAGPALLIDAGADPLQGSTAGWRAVARNSRGQEFVGTGSARALAIANALRFCTLHTVDARNCVLVSVEEAVQ